MKGLDVYGAGPDEAFFQRAPALCLVGGFDGYFKFVNPAFTRALGWKEKEVLSIHYLDLVHPEDVGPAEAAFVGLLEGGDTQISVRTRHKNGSYRWTEWTARTDLERRLIYSVGADVTLRRREAQERSESDARLRVLFDRYPLGVVVEGIDGRIVDVNDALCDLVGHTPRELIGTELSSIVGEEGWERQSTVRSEMLGGTASTHEVDGRFQGADGRSWQARVQIDLVRDTTGTPLYFMSQLRRADVRAGPAGGRSEPSPTHRELDVLRLAAQGLSTDEMADRLAISPTTVKTHLQNLYAKLAVSNRAAAVAEGLRRGLI